MPPKELIEERKTFGGNEDAINRHSIRVYKHKGVRFMIDETLDGCPPFFSLFKLPPPDPSGYGVTGRIIPVAGSEYWGDGLSWEAAELLAFEAIKGAA